MPANAPGLITFVPTARERLDSRVDVFGDGRSVDEVDAVRDALGLDRVLLLGHSWGALLAVEYLCQERAGASSA
jgi:pimeloyl-ACP methyl ester carboxylesterase